VHDDKERSRTDERDANQREGCQPHTERIQTGRSRSRVTPQDRADETASSAKFRQIVSPMTLADRHVNKKRHGEREFSVPRCFRRAG